MTIGEFWEAAAVTYLFSLGDYLESRTIEKTRSSIKALLDLAPRYGKGQEKRCRTAAWPGRGPGG
jgi:Cation transport ATPase